MNANKKYCFVIQPLSDEIYTKRFDEVFKPAIEECDLVAYRVDLDLSVREIISEIENKIRDSRLCFADISLDNPNVWYELGYASAIKKDVVIVCDENRSKFPFDISQRSIIRYKSTSPSDFSDLKNGIVRKIKNYISSERTSNYIISSPVKEVEGLQPFEIALLALIIGEQMTDEISVSIYNIKNMMEKSGFNDVAISIGIRLLSNKGFLMTSIDTDWNGNEFDACKLTEKGISFILSNPTLFNLGQKTIDDTSHEESDDLPF